MYLDKVRLCPKIIRNITFSKLWQYKSEGTKHIPFNTISSGKYLLSYAIFAGNINRSLLKCNDN